MKRLIPTIFTVFLLVILSLNTTYSQVPRIINYQASLMDSENKPINGTVTMTFAIFWDEITGVIPLWAENRSVEAINGFVNIYLGEVVPINLSFDRPYWLEVKLGDAPAYPRTMLTTVPYAYMSIRTHRADTAYIAESVVDGGVKQNMLDPGVKALPWGPARGYLSGTYPNPTLNLDSLNKLVTLGFVRLNQNAGGALTGQYPNPSIRDTAVTTSKIRTSAVTTVKIADTAVTQRKIALDAVNVDNIDGHNHIGGTLAPLASAIMWDGSTVYWGYPSPGGGAGGDLGGLYPSPMVTGLRGVPIASVPSPSDNEVYVFRNYGTPSTLDDRYVSQRILPDNLFSYNNTPLGAAEDNYLLSWDWNGGADPRMRWINPTTAVMPLEYIGNSGTFGAVLRIEQTDVGTGPYAIWTDGIVGSGSATFTGDMIGIGTTTPNNSIQVIDLINFDNSTNGTFLGYLAGNVNVSNDNTFVGNRSGQSNTGGTANTGLGFVSLQNNTTGNENTAVGVQALWYNTTGYNNSAFGYQSLASNTVGYNNTAYGMFSLVFNVTGNNNTAIGEGSGFNSTGSGNVFLGYQAGYNETGDNKLYIANSVTDPPLIYGDFSTSRVGIGTITPNNSIQVQDLINFDNSSNGTFLGYQAGNVNTGGNNTFVGYQAGLSNTIGLENTANGYQALYSNTAGSDNTAIGITALYSNTTGSYNTANGVFTLYSNSTGAGNTADGALALYSNTTGNNNTAIGRVALYSNTIGDQNTAIGSNALYSNTTGINNTASGYYALYLNVVGNYNTAYGVNTLMSNTVSFNTAVGFDALFSNTTGTNNTATGANSLVANITGSYNSGYGSGSLQSNTTGSYNSANGYNALYSNTTGNANTANGSEALYSNTTGNGNTAYGFNALYSNTTGLFNTANGNSALWSNTTGNANTAYGIDALRANTTGGNNTASGYQALYLNTTGNNNTAIGREAGLSNLVGSSNVFIGYQAGYNETGNDKLYIANTSVDPPLIYGDFSTGAVALGTVTPTAGAILTVSNTATGAGISVDNGAGTGSAIAVANGGGDLKLSFGTLAGTDAGITIPVDVSVFEITAGTETGAFTVTMPTVLAGKVLFIRNNSGQQANLSAGGNIAAGAGATLISNGSTWFKAN